MSARNDAISKHIAAAIVRNTRKRWAGLQADALEGTTMSSEVTKVSNATIPHTTPLGSNADAQRQASAPSSDSINSGMNVSNSDITISVKPVDRLTICGSYSGDSRAKDSTDVTAAFRNQSGPRGAGTSDSENAGG